MKENYDVIVVGAGPAGIMTCYELYLKNPELEVLLIDKGHDVMNRHCPIKDKKIKQCPVHKDREPGCIPACSITDGLAQRGSFIIDPEGKIVVYEVNAGNVGRNADELLRRLHACQFVYEHGDNVCPAKWKLGEKTIQTTIENIGK